MIRKILLVCGVLSSLLYVAMNIFVPMQWEGYSLTSQSVSELSAIDAPTRPLWVLLGFVYTSLLAAFGYGVWQSTGRNGRLRVVGGLLFAMGIIGLFWPPMHPRGTAPTMTDALHIVFTLVMLLLMVVAIGFGAAALGKWFRFYSIATIFVFIAFGVLTWMDAPEVAANLPTPRIGVWERINIAAFLLWVAVLAVTLVRGEGRHGHLVDLSRGIGQQNREFGGIGS